MLAHLWPVIENIILCFAELLAQRKRRKLLNGEGESTTSTEHLDKQAEERDSRNNIEPQEFKLGGGGGGGEPVDTAKDQGEGRQPTDRGHEGLSELFECELTAAKEKCSQCQASSGGGNVKLKPSFGHQAGFDAFMTGYSFASIAVSLCQASNSSGPGPGGREGSEGGNAG